MILLKVIQGWWREILILVFGAFTIFTLVTPAKPPITITKTVEVERKVVEYKTKIEYRDKVKTITRQTTKPDGTKIVEQVKEDDRSTISDTQKRQSDTKIKESVVTKTESSPRILEFGYHPVNNSFRLGVLYPLGNSPISVGGSITYDYEKNTNSASTQLGRLRPRGFEQFGFELGVAYRF